MTDQHPITPPPKLVQQWVAATESNDCIGALPTNFEQRICTAAAHWGADQELEACCEWLSEHRYKADAAILRTARRPKPPSLKEQALAELESLRRDVNAHGLGFDAPAIRRALEQLHD